MKIAILGYGKMGRAIESIAESRGHSIVLKVNDKNLGDLTKENLSKADVAIEFSRPESAFSNILICFESGVPVVSGTTGWLDQLTKAKVAMKENKGGLFYASNYSVGVNIFFEVNKVLAKLMKPHDTYSVEMEEIHHTQKLDAPSGTAITLAEGVIENSDKLDTWVNEMALGKSELGIISKRIDKVPGTHTVEYTSKIDTIEIKHTAHSREGFATGAVVAAEFMNGKEGFYGMKDMLGF